MTVSLPTVLVCICGLAFVVPMISAILLFSLLGMAVTGWHSLE